VDWRRAWTGIRLGLDTVVSARARRLASNLALIGPLPSSRRRWPCGNGSRATTTLFHKFAQTCLLLGDTAQQSHRCCGLALSLWWTRCRPPVRRLIAPIRVGLGPARLFDRAALNRHKHDDRVRSDLTVGYVMSRLARGPVPPLAKTIQRCAKNNLPALRVHQPRAARPVHIRDERAPAEELHRFFAYRTHALARDQFAARRQVRDAGPFAFPRGGIEHHLLEVFERLT
jgi:hypothetical protein